MMPILLAILLGLTAVVIVIYPLLGLNAARGEDATPAPIADAAEHERTAKQALLDVDFDYRLGNLEATDYADLRERYERRALSAMKARYDHEHELDALIDQQLAHLRAQQNAQRGSHTSTKSHRRSPSSPATVRRSAKTDSDSSSAQGIRARRRRGA